MDPEAKSDQAIQARLRAVHGFRTYEIGDHCTKGRVAWKRQQVRFLECELRQREFGITSFGAASGILLQTPSRRASQCGTLSRNARGDRSSLGLLPQPTLTKNLTSRFQNESSSQILRH